MYSYSPFLSSYPYSRPGGPAPIYNHRPQQAYPSANYGPSYPSTYGPSYPQNCGPSYPAAPINTMPQDYSRFSSTVEHYDPGQPQRRVWSEKIPYERAYVDYHEQRHIEYIPQERAYTDYIELEHQEDLIPVPQIQKRYEYLPVDRFRSTTDYMEVKNSQVLSNSQYGYGCRPQNSQYGYGYNGGPSLLAPSSPYRNYY